jgi:hypothetical protein
MPINYNALREGAVTTEVPPDGGMQATLDRAALVETSNGERVVTEWTSADGRYGWTSWNRFDTTGLIYTRELLQGLGVDLSVLMNDDDLKSQLQAVEGGVFNVRLASQKGSQGDRWFTSTYVDGRSAGVQETLDVPMEDSDLPEPGEVVTVPDDEDIPF